MKPRIARLILTVSALLSLLGGHAAAQSIANSTYGNNASFVAGKFVANSYNYGGAQSAQVATGNASTGSSTITIRGGYIVLPDGRAVVPFAVGVPIIINDGVAELVVPTSVSGCFKAQGMNQDLPLVTCTITASFAAIHGAYAGVLSGTGGIAEAVADAYNWGGGVVVLAPGLYVNNSCTGCYATVATAIAALLPYPNVALEDDRVGSPQLYSLSQGTASFLAVPTTLTATTAAPVSTPVGAYGTGTYHLCISYVDIAGNEGPCSLDFSEAGVATGSFVFTAPAASTGAVGYTIYISLTSGTYALAYQVPLTSSICTLTKIETTTPACAVSNALYGQSGATATVTAITVNTSPIALQLGAASTTTDYVGNSNARTSYIYTPSSRLGVTGVLGSSYSFTAGPATVATTVPQVLGTIAVPAGFMNTIGRTIRVCGKTTETTTASATVQAIQLWWDGAGSNAAGVPVLIGNLQAPVGTAVAAVNNGSFCETFVTTVAGAGVTAGSLLGGNSTFGLFPVSAQTQAGEFAGNDIKTAAVASLNLAGGAGFTTRLHVVQLHTGGTDVSPQLLNVTVEVL